MVKFPPYNEVQRKQSKGIPFEVTYHPLSKQLEGILRSRSHYLLNTNAEVNQTLTSGPIVFNRDLRVVAKNNLKYLLMYLEQTIS